MYQSPKNIQEHVIKDGNNGSIVDYLKNGYFDGKYIRRELLMDKAQQIAKALKGGGLTTNQFRRFYDYARALERKLDLHNGEFKSIEGDLVKMVSLAAATVARKNAPQLFKEFMQKNIDNVTDGKSFRRGFLEHLQAVLAFHGYFEKGGR